MPPRQAHLNAGDQSFSEALLHRHDWLSHCIFESTQSRMPSPSYPQVWLIACGLRGLNHPVSISHQVEFQMPTTNNKDIPIHWEISRISRLARDKGQISLWAKPNSLLHHGTIMFLTCTWIDSYRNLPFDLYLNKQILQENSQ